VAASDGVVSVMSILGAVSSSAPAAHWFPHSLATSIFQDSLESSASQSRNWLSVADSMRDELIHLLSVNSLCQNSPQLELSLAAGRQRCPIRAQDQSSESR